MVLTAKSFAIGSAEEKLLYAIHQYHFLTAQQLCTLLYSDGSLKYVMAKLKMLTQNDYLLRIYLPRGGPYGRPLSVYTLARKGHHYLATLGLEMPLRARVADAPQSALFLE